MQTVHSGFLGAARNRADIAEEPLLVMQNAPQESKPAPAPVYAPPPLVQFATTSNAANLELNLAVVPEPPRASARVQEGMERLERLPSQPAKPSPVNNVVNQQINAGSPSRGTPERLPNASDERRIANQNNPTQKAHAQQIEENETESESNYLLYGGIAFVLGVGAWWYFTRN